jgi:predicted kinase
MELLVLVGLQGAGKSTLYRQRFAGTHAHVSMDLWPRARDKRARQLRAVHEALASGRPVVVDNTNATPEERAPLVAAARAHGVRVEAYFFDVAVGDCLRRNAGRLGPARVPPVALFATAKRLRAPTLEEGFDAVHRVHLDGDEVVVG